MSQEHREKLRQAQLAYTQNDPRWADHRQKLGDAQRKPEQRARLSAAQLAYMATDKWPEHRERMQAAAFEVTRITLYPEEIQKAVELRRKGRNFEYIGEELCVDHKIIRREFRALGLPTGRISHRPKAKRGKGHWRSFEPAEVASLKT